MNINEQIAQTLGIEIDPSVGENLSKSIKSVQDDKQAFAFALHSLYLGFDPTEALIQRHGKERTLTIMEEINASMEFEEELLVNILYIAAVWAGESKKKCESLGVKPKAQVHALIDEIAKSCVRHWTITPIVNQSGFQETLGLSQPRVSKALSYLERKGVLVKTKQGGMFGGKKTSNVYRIGSQQDYTPEEMKAAFEALNLKATSPTEQIREYVGASSGITTEGRYDAQGNRQYNW